MYEYRRMTPRERVAAVAQRRDLNWPWHAPPHFSEGRSTYLISAACFEHRPILYGEQRRWELAEALVVGSQQEIDALVSAWVVLPNHYHLLVQVDLDKFRTWVGRLHNGKSTQWNRQDAAIGR